jgi:DNA-binding response OmpR family regulator
MPSGTVLIVDDDAVLRRSLARALRLAGFTTDVAEGGRDALARIAAGRPDVVVLDVSMPDLSGTEVCRRLRADGNEVPVVMLSALDEADDRISGLQAGADDYLVKPFVVDADTRTARRNGAELDLTRREFDLLEVLARNQGVVLSRDRLLELVWGYDFDVGTNAVDTFVSYLRRKTEAGGASRLIHTVRGIGFLMRAR